jgi:hypothetical protein
MYPMSTTALTRAQASRRELATDYRDAFVLDQDGHLRKIERVSVLGPWGESFWRKLLSRLTDAWRIDIELSAPLDRTLDEVKQLIVSCMESPQSAENMRLGELQERQSFVDAVHAARNVDDLLILLRLPAPEDALDVL